MDLLDGPEAEPAKEMPRGKGRGHFQVSWMGRDGAGMLIPV